MNMIDKKDRNLQNYNPKDNYTLNNQRYSKNSGQTIKQRLNDSLYEEKNQFKSSISEENIDPNYSNIHFYNAIEEIPLHHNFQDSLGGPTVTEGFYENNKEKRAFEELLDV